MSAKGAKLLSSGIGMLTIIIPRWGHDGGVGVLIKRLKETGMRKRFRKDKKRARCKACKAD